MMILSQKLVCTKVTPNNECRQKLPKITEYKLLVYVNGCTVQKTCYMNIKRNYQVSKNQGLCLNSVLNSQY